MRMIKTPRLRLHRWDDRHREAFAAMHADPEVMADYGGPIGRADSDEKFERYVAAQRDHGISRWAVETIDGAFLGYAGVMPRSSREHPLGAHVEIGWRFARNAWGHGYATESARAALLHAIDDVGLRGIVSYTSADNARSQAVMARLDLVRDPARDFTTLSARGAPWRGLVWVVPTGWPRG
ncbi:GNAT family N-acetyltransferase [Bradyrhizobium viridifuturi]|jgi:RimJ/RimL family protein N-acetyltransferase|nr:MULTISPECIES: GNAT family N-acetyltransferase [Bradyrhizobium]PSO15776.1 GNAT family N-acetyltransferase [Bradyrhizobium sp. MOS004]QRI67154.1 GNAT family N-acetyltransferase [Bradyrhizobium sp. PSBB068]MBR1019164.1 GNAT family N-acetyltransferase [Bradyrhizobium viridifuturi]MBR1034684.1 GNAT family N-acetyltransferase [Bradyrhizobium viridifuturi]MBR1042931.1 GNAT family N-acetyltransferase [Bradyrhizobium viridifuturi]